MAIGLYSQETQVLESDKMRIFSTSHPTGQNSQETHFLKSGSKKLASVRKNAPGYISDFSKNGQNSQETKGRKTVGKKCNLY